MNKVIDVVVFQCARLRGSSSASLAVPVSVCGTSRVWVGVRSDAVVKSRSERLRKSLRVLGADDVGEV